ncbi:MAG: hypothetical protein AB7V62_04330 [Thermoleophilia bacterium]
MTEGGPPRGGRETREQLVARVQAEQQDLHPVPVYGTKSMRRLKIYLAAIVPIGVLLGWLSGIVFGWDPLEWFGFAVGLWLALGYIGYVLLAERDDGRIQKDVKALMEERGSD